MRIRSIFDLLRAVEVSMGLNPMSVKSEVVSYPNSVDRKPRPFKIDPNNDADMRAPYCALSPDYFRKETRRNPRPYNFSICEALKHGEKGPNLSPFESIYEAETEDTYDAVREVLGVPMHLTLQDALNHANVY